jgi:type I restriction enzyme S subunit
MENGKGVIALNLKNDIGFGSTEFHVLRPIENLSNPYWLYTITIFPKFRIDAKKIMIGTGGQLRVPINYLSNYMISCPPIDLQNKFANFAQQAEQSKQQLQKSLDSLNASMRALINENLK